jgi:hypothetical protein
MADNEGKATEEATNSDEEEIDYESSWENYSNLKGINSGKYRTDEQYIDKVAGAPFKYGRSDIGNRVYSETLGADAPLVSLLPGLPNIFGGKVNEDDFSVKELIESPESIFDIFDNQKIDAAEEDDLRFYTFDEKRHDYIRYVGEMLVHVMSMLGVEDTDSPVDMYEMYNLAGPTFYFDKASTITESIDNTYDKPAFAQMTEQFSGVAKDLAALMNRTGENINEDVSNMENPDGTKLSDKLGTLLTESTSSFVKGSNMLFPKIWKDSNFRKSYSLQFKFRSPYGTPKAIYKYVFAPTIMLLAFALPRQNSLMGYKSPFIIKAECPGHFSIDIGAISSMTIKKGGSDDLWTTSGLPLQIDVTVNIEDLYSTMRMNKTAAFLAVNKGMTTYLDNMAGLGIADPILFKRFEHRVKSGFYDIRHINQTIKGEMETYMEKMRKYFPQ